MDREKKRGGRAAVVDVITRGEGRRGGREGGAEGGRERGMTCSVVSRCTRLTAMMSTWLTLSCALSVVCCLYT